MADKIELYQELHQLRQRVAALEKVETECEELKTTAAGAVKDMEEWKRLCHEAEEVKREFADNLKSERDKKADFRKMYEEKLHECDAVTKKLSRLETDQKFDRQVGGGRRRC